MQADNFDRPAKSRIVSASFVEHRLRVILTLYKGTFASGSNSTVIDSRTLARRQSRSQICRSTIWKN